MDTTKDVKKKIITFLIITLALSSIFNYIVISAGNIRAGGGLYALGAMWSPGIAALITALIYQKNLRGFGWKWGKTKYQLWSYLTPFLYTLVAYTFVWIVGLGGFPDQDFVNEINTKVVSKIGFNIKIPYLIIAIYLLVVASVGMIQSCVFALGEEIGWSGFLVPQLAKITSFTKTALLRGIIWAVWHYPIILFADYKNSGSPTWYSLVCFTVMIIGTSFAFAWLRLKSGSLWTGMFLHASHNLFIQGVFTPLTKNTGITQYFTNEFGAALAVISLVVAYIFWKKRVQLAIS